MIALLVATLVLADPPPGPVRVGSKVFTESVILAEMGRRLVDAAGLEAIHRRELGGSKILFGAIESGNLDAYPEYTGTIRREIFAGQEFADEAAVRAALAARGVAMSAPIGFYNNYAIGMREEVADRLGIKTISDLRAHPKLKFGFSSEFLERADGWPGLRDRYGLPQRDVRGLDHVLAYRALADDQIQATELYTTDAEIVGLGLRVLEDDAHYFPPYQCVWLYRAGLDPRAVAALGRLAGAIDEPTMARMNARAKVDRVSEDVVAADFLRDRLGLDSRVAAEGFVARLLRRLGEHLTLVVVSLLAAILVAVPLGVVAARRPRLGQVVLAVTGVVQTVPSIALLVFMIPWLGIGAKPALVALFLYSLLPIVRNTVTGLRDIPPPLREAAEAMGLTPLARLWRVELPLASRSILAGIKTAAVIDVGTATIGALIGAGGFGQPIFTGMRRDDVSMILFEGAIPSAVLALAVQGGFDLLERWIVPAGLRA